MIDFLAQATATKPITATDVGVATGGVTLAGLIVKVAGDMIKEWWKGRTRLGRSLQNASSCPMTPEANAVIVAKDGRGELYKTHFQAEAIKEQHEKQDDVQKEIANTLLKVATILEGMERRGK